VRLQNKIALITGGASGMGESTAFAFAREGARVVVVDIDGERAVSVVNQIKEQGGMGLALQADVTMEEDIQHMVMAARSEYGRLDILDNNAGGSLIKPITETTEADFHRIVNLNVLGVVLACKHAIPVMIEGGGGSIINIASLSALRARPNMALYVASKGAVAALTRSLAIDFGREGIRANCICPAATDTPMLARHYARLENGQAKRKADEAVIPLGRHALPEDIAQLAVYLASDESQYISGQVITVDGGSMAGTTLI
jgi:NAD(P)-dependent dehydrogenase (short-subunit alcohol dehydrogenase family)